MWNFFISILICLCVFPRMSLTIYVCFFNRLNSKGTHYTGALVGLGCDGRTGQVIYPADDIEVVFDINIAQEDLMIVSWIYMKKMVKKMLGEMCKSFSINRSRAISLSSTS